MTQLSSKVAQIIAAETDSNFMRVARILRSLQEENPAEFIPLAKQGGIKQRHAYALARVAQQFDGIGIPDERLHQIGWSKLAIIGKHLTEKNVEKLLKLAEQFTSHQLASHLRGDKPEIGARAMALHMSPKEDKRFRSLLIKYGAKPSGNGLVGKESALAALLDDVEGLLSTKRSPRR